jgi:hypothetical protein
VVKPESRDRPQRLRLNPFALDDGAVGAEQETAAFKRESDFTLCTADRTSRVFWAFRASVAAMFPGAPVVTRRLRDFGWHFGGNWRANTLTLLTLPVSEVDHIPNSTPFSQKLTASGIPLSSFFSLKYV